jgi:glycosyltransferase involved in cell wall biosynthesis
MTSADESLSTGLPAEAAAKAPAALPPVSLVVITLNEEANIARCIGSVPFAAEVLVVDSGSSDRTCGIARSLGARVEHQDWLGYARQKALATARAANDWILSLDGDEALSPELAGEIAALLRSGEPSADAYAAPRLTWYLGRWLRHGATYPDLQVRLFDRRRARWNEARIHESIVAANVGRLRHPILHWTFPSIAHQIDTINRYSSLRALDLHEQGERFSAARLIPRMCARFLATYVGQKGYRDGIPGLMMSLVAAFATFLRWAKLREIEVGGGKPAKGRGEAERP